MGRGREVGRVAGEVGLVASVVAFHVIDHRSVPERWHPITHGLAGAAALGAGALGGLGLDELGLDRRRAVAGFKAGLVVGAATAAAVAVAVAVPVTRPVFDDPRAVGGGKGQLVRRLLVDIPIGTAVYEEAVFRGTLTGLARRDLPPRAARAVVAALFGAWHVLPAIEDRAHNPVARRVPLVASVAPTVVATTVAGWGLGRLRDRTGSLVAPIVAHAVTNASGLVAARLVSSHRSGRGDREPANPPSPGGVREA